MTTDTVKTLGRTKLINDVLWFSLSGTGVEFYFKGKKCSFELVSDSIYEEEMHQARFAVYINEKPVIDDVMNVRKKEVCVLDADEETECIIRLIKLSEASDSTMGIKDIMCDKEAVMSPTEKKKLAIEFIGDSITCGYGVDGTLEDTYSTHNENVTKAYAYLTAQELQADYSMVSYSGHGIISGYTETEEKITGQLVPSYYTKLGNSYGEFNDGMKPCEVEWDFSQFVPDIVVINLGTNDASYTKGKEERCQEYVSEYCHFLSVVRERNPKAVILCVLGLMGQELCTYAAQAVTRFRALYGEERIYFLKLSMQPDKNGVVVDYHPTYESHKQAAEEVVHFIREQIL